jgi:hypothetical protein
MEYRQFTLAFILFWVCYFLGFYIFGFFLFAFSLCVFEDPEDFAADDEEFAEAPFEDPGYDYDIYTFKKRRQNLLDLRNYFNEISLLWYCLNFERHFFFVYERVKPLCLFSPIVFKRHRFGIVKSHYGTKKKYRKKK